MRGIKLAHGAIFVEHKGVTVRILPSGELGVSPIMLPSLEWDLRTEPPGTWEYLGDADVKDLGTDVLRQIESLVDTPDL